MNEVDGNKHFTWPAYVINLRARIRCPVCMLVITADEQVARWARTPIELGAHQRFSPLVLSPAGVPQVTDADAARADPELAVLSAIAHGRRAELLTAVEIAQAAITASVTLDADRATLYVDLVLTSISEAARRALQAMKPANYEFQSDFARHYFALGKAEGERGKTELLMKLATLKFGPLTDAVQQRIRTATAAELEAMAERLLAAATVDSLFG